MNQRPSTQTASILNTSPSLVIIAGLISFVLAMTSIKFASTHHYASIWVVNAVLLIFIFRSSQTLTWWYFTAGLIANVTANFIGGAPLVIALAYAASNSIEVLLPILFVSREDDKPILINRFDAQLITLAMCIPAGCLVSAILATLLSTSGQWDIHSSIIAFSWFTIDLLAMMAIVPLGLSITKERCLRLLSTGKVVELIIVLLSSMTITWISTHYTQIRFIVILMPLLYAAFRLGLVGTCLVSFGISSIYTLNLIETGNTNNLYSTMPELISYSFLLMCITLIPALIIAILIEQRDEAVINIIRNEAETEKLSQRLQMAINAGKIGIFNFDILKNDLIWDERMYELYDIAPDEFTHNFHAWESRVHPGDYEQALSEFNQALAGIKNFDTEFRIITSNGKTRWVRAKAHVLRDTNNKPVTMLGMNWDITSEKLMVHELYTEKERLSTTLKAIGDAVIVSDENGIITFINPIAEQLMGCSARTIVGKQLYEICKITSELTGELLPNPIDVCLKQKQTHYYKEEGILVNHIGSRYFIQDSAAPVILPTGEIAGCVLVLQDVTMNRNLQTELKHQATHDVLTGLFNRREVELKIKAILSDARTAKNINSFFFIDLDNFKTVNDSAGHAAGDELLRRVAEILTSNVRSTDMVARLGGDEFAVILPECTPASAISIANNLIEKVKHYKFVWDGETYMIGLSIGLISFKSKTISFEELLSRADAACYTAKNLGGNQVSSSEGQERPHSTHF